MASDVAAPTPSVGELRPRDLPASVELRALVELLTRTDLADLPELDVLGAVSGWQQVIDMAGAAQAAAVSELAARRVVSSSFPVDDVACALSTTQHAASSLVARADGLRTHPVLADAMRAGTLDARKVDVLLDEVARLPRDDADDVLRRAVAEGEGLTAPLLRRRVRRFVAAVDPEAALRRAARSRTERCVRLDWAADSMAWVSALLPAPDAVAAFSVIDTLARAGEGEGDVRTLAQRRADAFSDIFGGILATGELPDGRRLPTRQGFPVGVQLTLAARTLVGLDDLPGEIAGYGPIPAAMARDLASQADRFRPVLTDDEGHVLAVGARTHPMSDWRIPDSSAARPPAPIDLTGSSIGSVEEKPGYRPGAVLRRLVTTRDETCMFPGCRQPALACDLDHVEPFDPSRPAAGQTHPANLQPLCRHHHRSKTHHGWTMRRDERTGDVHVKSPLGHDYVRVATTILLSPSAYRHQRGRRHDVPAPPTDDPPPF
jgi:hypothetical protein